MASAAITVAAMCRIRRVMERGSCSSRRRVFGHRPHPLREFRIRANRADYAASRMSQGRGLSSASPQAVTTLNYSINHARSGSNSCSVSTAPLVVCRHLRDQLLHIGRNTRASPWTRLQAPDETKQISVPPHEGVGTDVIGCGMDYLRRTAGWVRGFQVEVTCTAPLQPSSRSCGSAQLSLRKNFRRVTRLF